MKTIDRQTVSRIGEISQKKEVHSEGYQSVDMSTHSVQTFQSVSETSTVRMTSSSVRKVEVTTNEESDMSIPSSPTLLLRMTDVRVKSGEMAQFKCSFDGQPFTGIMLDHNGRRLADTERVISSHSRGLQSLIIQGVELGDQGTYRCTTLNKHGENSTSAQLTVEGG